MHTLELCRFKAQLCLVVPKVRTILRTALGIVVKQLLELGLVRRG